MLQYLKIRLVLTVLITYSITVEMILNDFVAV